MSEEKAEYITESTGARNTRPEPDAPVATGGGKWSAVWIDAENKQPSIKFWAENQEQAERICDALSDSADAFSTPKKEAPIEADDLTAYCASAVAHINSGHLCLAKDVLAKLSDALSSRSGVWVSRECAECAMNSFESDANELFDDVNCAGQEGATVETIKAIADQANRLHGYYKELKQSLEQSNGPERRD